MPAASRQAVRLIFDAEAPEAVNGQPEVERGIRDDHVAEIDQPDRSPVSGSMRELMARSCARGRLEVKAGGVVEVGLEATLDVGARLAAHEREDAANHLLVVAPALLPQTGRRR